jgi:hypothetical protein
MARVMLIGWSMVCASNELQRPEPGRFPGLPGSARHRAGSGRLSGIQESLRIHRPLRTRFSAWSGIRLASGFSGPIGSCCESTWPPAHRAQTPACVQPDPREAYGCLKQCECHVKSAPIPFSDREAPHFLHFSTSPTFLLTSPLSTLNFLHFLLGGVYA